MPVTFPSQPLGFTIEAAFGADLTAAPATWTWTDITPWWSDPDPITLTWGRRERAKQAEPVQISFRLNNTDGRFTPDDPRSPYWPHVVEQVPIRFRIDPGTGLVERFAGFVAAWPISWPGSTSHLAVTQITAHGVMRRLGATALPLRSALYRAVTTFAPAPVAYWPIEDGQAASRVMSGLPAGFSMSVEGAPKLGADGPPGAAGAVDFSAAGGRLSGPVVGMPAGGWLVSCWMLAPRQASDIDPYASVDWSTPDATGWQRYLLITGSTDTATPVGKIALIRLPEPSGSGVTTLTGSTDIRGAGWTHVAVCATPNGTTVDYELYVNGELENMTSVTETAGPIATIRTSNSFGFGLSGLTSINVPVAGSVSHIIATTPDRIADITGSFYQAGLAHAGETAAARITRLCQEEGLPVTILGDPAQTEQMGPQSGDTLLALLQDAEATDRGYLADTTGHGLTYLPRVALYNQPAAITLDGDKEELAFPFEPVLDDSGTLNEATVSREGGSEATVVDSVHQQSRGLYADSETINVATDEVLRHHASWMVHVGTTPGLRYPQIGIDLTRHPTLIPAWLSVRPSSRLRAINLPLQHPLGGLDQLIDGATESITRRSWTVATNVRPAAPWRVGVYGQDRYDTAGSELAAAVDADDTALLVATTSGPTWTTNPADMPFDVLVGGERARVTAVAPAVADSFTRTAVGGWGTSDSGHAWTVTPTASEFSADGSAGTIAIAAVNTARRALLPTTLLLADLDMYYTASSPAAAGANIEASAMLRIDPANAGATYLYAEVEFTPTGTVTARLVSRVASVETTLAGTVTVPGLAHAAGVPFRVRARAIGNTVRMKVWAAAGAEPDAWTLTGSASTISAAGRCGVRGVVNTGSTNVLPVAMKFDDIAVVNPQTFTVTRSVNGITKTHPAGSDVRLADPVVYAL